MYVVEDSFKNHRNFFSVIFVPYPDLEHQPNDGVGSLRGKAPRPKFIDFLLIVPQFVRLLVSWPNIPAAH